jgi:hypothetical protein
MQVPAIGGSFPAAAIERRDLGCRDRSDRPEISVPQSKYRCCRVTGPMANTNPPERLSSTFHAAEKHDMVGLAAIARHNDGSMGKFSYRG